MKVLETSLKGVLIVEPDVFKDERGFFMETYQQKRYTAEGIDVLFVQDNMSFSKRGTLRGMHYQFPHLQDKLVQVVDGEIFDVAVDIRYGSPTFGQWTGVYLSGENRRQLFIPRGFAHGFCVTAPLAYVIYKCSDFYMPEYDAGIVWNDPGIGIDWPVSRPLVSKKDQGHPRLSDIPADSLPPYDS